MIQEKGSEVDKTVGFTIPFFVARKRSNRIGGSKWQLRDVDATVFSRRAIASPHPSLAISKTDPLPSAGVSPQHDAVELRRVVSHVVSHFQCSEEVYSVL